VVSPLSSDFNVQQTGIPHELILGFRQIYSLKLLTHIFIDSYDDSNYGRSCLINI
jgi:hypothetical protein